MVSETASRYMEPCLNTEAKILLKICWQGFITFLNLYFQMLNFKYKEVTILLLCHHESGALLSPLPSTGERVLYFKFSAETSLHTVESNEREQWMEHGLYHPSVFSTQSQNEDFLRELVRPILKQWMSQIL